MASVNVKVVVPVQDFMGMMPSKFIDSQLLIDFMTEYEDLLTDYLNNVNDMQDLLDPNNVPLIHTVDNVEVTTNYLNHLGSLIGVELSDYDTVTEKALRKEVLTAIDWYKLKGTYHAMKLIISSAGLNVNIYDLYTNDYTEFIQQEWFVGDEGENPFGLDTTYYKSPHFGFEIPLIVVYNILALGDYLWDDDLFVNVAEKIEKVRPVNTIPHYNLLLSALTDESGNVFKSAGDVYCRITGNWGYDSKYFDEGGSGDTFDTGEPSVSPYLFDVDPITFLKSIVHWKLGTG